MVNFLIYNDFLNVRWLFFLINSDLMIITFGVNFLSSYEQLVARVATKILFVVMFKI